MTRKLDRCVLGPTSAHHHQSSPNHSRLGVFTSKPHTVRGIHDSRSFCVCQMVVWTGAMVAVSIFSKPFHVRVGLSPSEWYRRASVHSDA